jgi:succinoglycan biosynthesis transport protein ExoP
MELRHYYDIFLRSWRLILIGTLIPGLVAFVISLVIKPTYRAQAEVSLYKTKSDLALDERYLTLSEDGIVHYSNPDARRNTLVALATSDEVLAKTLEALPETLRSDWSLSRLGVTTHIDTSGNMIQLSVQSNSPEEATVVSNAWAQTFTDVANDIYQQPSSSLQAVTDQLSQVYNEYEKIQTDLESYLANSQIDELNYQISQKELAITRLKDAYLTATHDELINLLTAKQKIPQIISNAKLLRDKINSGPVDVKVSLANQLATLFLEVGSLNAGVNLPAEIQFSMPFPDTELSRADAIASIDQIINALTELQINLEEIVTNQSSALLSPPELEGTLGEEILKLQTELDPLRSQLETELATQRELTDSRDLAWENYLTLERKKTEFEIAATDVETEVIIAAQAVIPEEPISPKIILNSLIGLAFGFTVTSAFVVFRAQLRYTEALPI